MVGNRKAETKTHSLLKHFIASILERQGHKVSIEYRFSGGFPDSDIGDVFDHKTGLVYEIQSRSQAKLEKEKCRKYLLNTGVRDVIFLYVTDFSIQMPCSQLYRLLELKLGI